MIECHDINCWYHPKIEPFCGEEECLKYNREDGSLKVAYVLFLEGKISEKTHEIDSVESRNYELEAIITERT